MKNDCPVYFLTISEDPVTRETDFSNADGEEIARLKPEEGYLHQRFASNRGHQLCLGCRCGPSRPVLQDQG
jgi:hypothetical protein